MARPEAYFAGCWQDRRVLEEHGFERWPDAEELARYIFDIVDAFCDAQGVKLERNHRRKWQVVSKASDTEGRC